MIPVQGVYCVGCVRFELGRRKKTLPVRTLWRIGNRPVYPLGRPVSIHPYVRTSIGALGEQLPAYGLKNRSIDLSAPSAGCPGCPWCPEVVSRSRFQRPTGKRRTGTHSERGSRGSWARWQDLPEASNRCNRCQQNCYQFCFRFDGSSYVFLLLLGPGSAPVTHRAWGRCCLGRPHRSSSTEDGHRSIALGTKTPPLRIVHWHRWPQNFTSWVWGRPLGQGTKRHDGGAPCCLGTALQLETWTS